MSTDSEIIRASLTRPAMFAEIFERHARSIEAFARYRIGKDAAEDVLSETFLVAFRRRKDFDLATSSAVPWLFGIASRLIRRHRAVEARHWQSFVSAVAQDDHASSGGIDDALTRVDAERDVAALTGRIAGLRPADRDVLLLHAWQQMSYEDIAVALGIPVGTVRSRLNRVRRRLDPDRQIRAFEKNQQKGEHVGRV